MSSPDAWEVFFLFFWLDEGYARTKKRPASDEVWYFRLVCMVLVVSTGSIYTIPLYCLCENWSSRSNWECGWDSGNMKYHVRIEDMCVYASFVYYTILMLMLSSGKDVQ